MPTYMDVHNLQGATAIQVEQHHTADLAEQGKYGVEYLKYWFKGVARGDSPAQGAAALEDLATINHHIMA